MAVEECLTATISFTLRYHPYLPPSNLSCVFCYLTYFVFSAVRSRRVAAFIYQSIWSPPFGSLPSPHDESGSGREHGPRPHWEDASESSICYLGSWWRSSWEVIKKEREVFTLSLSCLITCNSYSESSRCGRSCDESVFRGGGPPAESLPAISEEADGWSEAETIDALREVV